MKRFLFPIESTGFPQYTDAYLGLDLASDTCRRFAKWIHSSTRSNSYDSLCGNMGEFHRQPVTVSFPIHGGGQLYFLSLALRETILPNGESVQNCISRNNYCALTDLINIPPDEVVDVRLEIDVDNATIRFLIIPNKSGPVFRTSAMYPREVFKDSFDLFGGLQ